MNLRKGGGRKREVQKEREWMNWGRTYWCSQGGTHSCPERRKQREKSEGVGCNSHGFNGWLIPCTACKVMDVYHSNEGGRGQGVCERRKIKLHLGVVCVWEDVEGGTQPVLCACLGVLSWGVMWWGPADGGWWSIMTSNRTEEGHTHTNTHIQWQPHPALSAPT